MGQAINIVRKVPISKVHLMESSQGGAVPPRKSNTKLIIGAIVVVVILVAAVVLVALGSGNNNSQSKVVYWTTVAPQLQKDQIERGLIDGGVSWEPYVSDSLVAGSADAVVWSEQIWPNHPCCAISVKTSLLQSNPDVVARLVRAHIDANAWMADALAHPGSANYTILLNMGADFSFRSTTVVQAALEHIKFGYVITDQVKQGLVDFTNMFIDLNQTSMQKIYDIGYSSVPDFIDHLANTSVVQAAMNVQPTDLVIADVNMGYLAGDLHQFARLVAMNATLFGGKNLFQKYGIAMHPVGPFQSGGEIMIAFSTGAIDAAYLGTPPTILRRLNTNTDVTIVALANLEGSAIIAKKGITTFAGLNNKTVATPGPASIQHLLLLVYAKQQGFTVKAKGT